VIKTKFSRILARHFRRLRIYYYMIAIIFFGTILFFYFRTTNSDRIMNDLSTLSTKWTSSEHSPFFNWLFVQFDFDQIARTEACEIDQRMKSILESIQGRIDEDLEKGKNVLQPVKINIDRLDYQEIPIYLEEQNLESLILDNLNLIPENKTPKDWNTLTPCFILRSKDDDRYKPQSFVFVPTQLVDRDENNRFQLPIQLKRELVFSKFMEKYLIEILKEIPKAQQTYFIPLSGFVRVCGRKGVEDQVKYYKDRFNFMQDFSDRLYFKPTIKEKFNIMSPYVDAGGQGIVRTYSVAILNHKWRIVGIIGADVQIGSIEKKLSVKSHGFNPFPQNPLIDFCDSNDLDRNDSWFKTKYNLLTSADKKGIVDCIQDKKRKSSTSSVMETTLNRFDFDADGNIIKQQSPPEDTGSTKKIRRIVYSLPLEGKKIAFFIFDKQRLTWQNNLFICFLVSLLIVFTLLIRFVYDHMIKRVREEEKKLELITHMHSSYVITDEANHIEACNATFENLVDEKNVIDNKFEEYLTKDSIKDLRFFLDSGKERFEFPVVIKTKSGIEKSAILINTQTAYHMDNKARISILIESENLESLVAEKYADRISHILKSPLHSILQIADQMRRKTAKPRYDDYFRLLEVEIAELKREISRLLCMLKMEYRQPDPDYKKFGLTKLVREIKEEYAPLLEKKKLGFNSNFAEGVSLTADRNMIKVTIENILDNALKYTQSGSISFYLYDSPQNAKIVIEDTGIGIPGDEVALIFQKGHRGNHPVVLGAPGKGIGLYHCKNFIDLHNGMINVESIVGKGSQFTILLPKNLDENKGE